MTQLSSTSTGARSARSQRLRLPPQIFSEVLRQSTCPVEDFRVALLKQTSAKAGTSKSRGCRQMTKILEARVGIEPTHKGFADHSLTTWVPRPCSARLRSVRKKSIL